MTPTNAPASTTAPAAGKAGSTDRSDKTLTPAASWNAETDPLLEITDLEVAFRSSTGLVPAVRKANLTLYPGQSVAIVGESGSGKSTLAHAVIGLLPGTGRVTGGTIRFQGRDITHPSTQELTALRGSSIGLVPQDPMSNLNPVWSIGFQVKEALRANGLAGVADDRLAAIAAAARAEPEESPCADSPPSRPSAPNCARGGGPAPSEASPWDGSSPSS